VFLQRSAPESRHVHSSSVQSDIWRLCPPWEWSSPLSGPSNGLSKPSSLLLGGPRNPQPRPLPLLLPLDLCDSTSVVLRPRFRQTIDHCQLSMCSCCFFCLSLFLFDSSLLPRMIGVSEAGIFMPDAAEMVLPVAWSSPLASGS